LVLAPARCGFQPGGKTKKIGQGRRKEEIGEMRNWSKKRK
jgi:hypothetical protein